MMSVINPGFHHFIFAISWVLWGFFLFFYFTGEERFTAMRGMLATILACSLLQLMVVIPLHIISRQYLFSDSYEDPMRFDVLCNTIGVVSGGYVMLWSLGLTIFLLFLAEKRDADRKLLALSEKPVGTDATGSTPI